MPRPLILIAPLALVLAVCWVDYKFAARWPAVFTAEVQFLTDDRSTSGLAPRPFDPKRAAANRDAAMREAIAVLKSREFLTRALALPQVRGSAWFYSVPDPLETLAGALAVAPRADHFQVYCVTLTLPARNEVVPILDAIFNLYIDYVKEGQDATRQADLRAFRQQVADVEREVAAAQLARDDCEALQQIDQFRPAVVGLESETLAIIAELIEQREGIERLKKVAVAGYDTDHERVKSYNGQLAVLNAQIAEQQKELQDIQAILAPSRAELKSLDTALAAATAKLTRTREEFTRQDAIYRTGQPRVIPFHRAQFVSNPK